MTALRVFVWVILGPVGGETGFAGAESAWYREGCLPTGGIVAREASAISAWYGLGAGGLAVNAVPRLAQRTDQASVRVHA